MLQALDSIKIPPTGVGGVDGLGAWRLMDSQVRGPWARQEWGEWMGAGRHKPWEQRELCLFPHIQPQGCGKAQREKSVARCVRQIKLYLKQSY